MNEHEATVRCHECLTRRAGVPIAPDIPILDFGCGVGAQVHAYRSQGYQAYGYDIADPSPGRQNSQLPWFRFRQEHSDPRSTRLEGRLRLPFDDGFFGFVFSQTAFEHVMDYDGTLSEISRVLRDRAFSLHTFPPRCIPIEPHAGAPLGSIFRSYRYLLFWARLGLLKRDPGESAKEAAHHQMVYLRDRTNYLPKSVIRELAGRYFRRVEFVDELFYSCWPGRLRALSPLFRTLPPLKHLHSALRMRILLLQK